MQRSQHTFHVMSCGLAGTNNLHLHVRCAIHHAHPPAWLQMHKWHPWFALFVDCFCDMPQRVGHWSHCPAVQHTYQVADYECAPPYPRSTSVFWGSNFVSVWIRTMDLLTNRTSTLWLNIWPLQSLFWASETKGSHMAQRRTADVSEEDPYLTGKSAQGKLNAECTLTKITNPFEDCKCCLLHAESNEKLRRICTPSFSARSNWYGISSISKQLKKLSTTDQAQ